ncbi:MAG TPA: response regulator, partial [Geminicoccaceae bacterium]|nr:response regulator [Geminicoccaceae bacterium]
ARAMGGSISVASRPGQGTTFRVALALAPPSLPPAGLRRMAACLAGGSLLVADPVARTRETMVGITTGWGLTVRLARNGRQALALLAEAADRGAPFDMVLVDRDLSEPSAEQIAAAVASEPRLRHARLVLTVASGMRGDAMAARAAGFAAYLRKPVDAGTPLECLRALRAQDGGVGDGLITVHSISERRPHCLHVLLADDNPVNCRLASIILERAGHTVDVVHDGLQAVEALGDRPYDVVLMDVQMPVMDGLQATGRVRALEDRRAAATPIVAITANAMRGDREACLAAGMNGYVAKPLSAASLLDEVDRHVGSVAPAADADPRPKFA